MSRIVVILVLFAALFVVARPPSYATEYTGFCDGKTDSATIYTVPQVNRLAYAIPGRDSIFRTMVMRIAADTGTTIPQFTGGNWGLRSRHHYSKDQPWNSTGTKLMIDNPNTVSGVSFGGVPSKLVLNGDTYAFLQSGVCDGTFGSNIPVKDSRWQTSTAYPNIRVGVTHHPADSVFINIPPDSLHWFDISTCLRTRGWRLPIRPNLIGQGEGNMSFDGRWIVLASSHRDSNETRPDSVVIVDMNPTSGGRVGAGIEIPDCGLSVAANEANPCRLGYVSISPSGLYIDVKYKGKGDFHRIFAVDTSALTISVQTMASGSFRCNSEITNNTSGWILPLKHADTTIDPADNADVAVGGVTCSDGDTRPKVAKVRLSDGAVTYVSKDSTGGFTKEEYVQHVSARCLDRPGWVYVSHDTATGNRRYDGEVVAYNIDGSKRMQRFAHNHAYERGTEMDVTPVPSRDGRRIIFASNWTSKTPTVPNQKEIKAYLIDARSVTPDTVADLAGDSLAKTKIRVRWSSPSDGHGLATSSYELRYQATTQITASNFSSATLISTGTPNYLGAVEKATQTGLTPDTKYYFAVKSSNTCNNKSGISNVTCLYTLPTSGPAHACDNGDGPSASKPAVEEAILSLGPLSPNPGAGWVRFSLPDGRSARLTVYDVSGRIVAAQDVGRLGPGHHVVPLSRERRLSPGVYFVELRHPQGRHRTTAIVLR